MKIKLDYTLLYNPIEKSLDVTPGEYYPQLESFFLGRFNPPEWLMEIMNRNNNVTAFNDIFEPLPIEKFNKFAKEENLDRARIPIIGSELCRWNIHVFKQHSAKKIRLILLPNYFPDIDYDYLGDIIQNIFNNGYVLTDHIGVVKSLSLSHILEMKSVRMLYPSALPETIYDPTDHSWNKGFKRQNPFATLKGEI